jgi:hypothetical protein
MPIFRLVPVEDGPGDWERSVYRGEAIIRAESEKDARAIAAASFALAKAIVPGARTTFEPWRNELSVRCERLTHEVYSDVGPRGLLQPSEWACEITFKPLS